MPSPLRETIPILTETTPAPFPAAGRPLERRGLSRLRLRLRPAAEADLPFLRALYGTTRSSEIAAAGWPPVLAGAFLANQFDLQHRHFVGGRLATDFWIIEQAGADVGRLYLDRSGSTWRVIDLALLPEAQGRGLGGALLRIVQAEARAHGADALDLHVLKTNRRAAALYGRLGFVLTVEESASHDRMIWPIS
jgi:GNAT superfamily N-acetyltransferase